MGIIFCFWRYSPPVGQGLLIHEVSRSHTTTVGLLWKSDQPFAETSTWQNTTLRTDKHPCLRWDSKPQSQRAPHTYALDRVATGTGMGFVGVPNKLISVVISRSSCWSYFAFFVSCCNQPPVYHTKTKPDQLFKKLPAFVTHHRIARVYLCSVCWTMPFSFRALIRKCRSFRLSPGLSSGPFSWSCSGISYEFVSSCTVLNTFTAIVDLSRSNFSIARAPLFQLKSAT